MKLSSLTIYLFAAAAIFQTSCRSSKDLIMLQDFNDNLSLYNIPGEAPEYRIKPFDNLYLSILTLDPEVNKLFNPSSGTGTYSGTQQMYGDRASQYINGYMVAADGTITIPIVGNVQIAGFSLMEAQDVITAKAREYLREPSVKVKVLNFKVNVTGEVGVPGLYYNYEGSLNIIDAISMARGITEYADLKNVLVIRHQEDITKTYNLDFTNKDVYYSDAFYLQPNDVIYIRPNKYRRTRENSTIYQLALSTVSTLAVIVTLLLK